MPTYLCHGFRWQRRSIRVFVVVQNLDDAAPEWIIRRGTARALLESFYALFDFLPYSQPPPPLQDAYHHHHQHNPPSPDPADPDYGRSNGRRGSRSRSRSRRQSAARPNTRQSGRGAATARPYPTAEQWHSQALRDADDEVLSQEWSAVKVLEEYDPLDLSEVSRPHAYVADYVARVDLSAGVAEAMARYEERLRADPDPAMAVGAGDETGRGARRPGHKRAGWLEKLRDQLQRGEEIRWYVVVNGDEEREWPHDLPGRGVQQGPPAAAAAAAGPPGPGAAARAQMEHHAQYTHQQQLFEGADREREKARERLRYELGGDKDILNDRRERDPGFPYGPRGPDRRPSVPQKDGPVLRPRMSVEAGLRPKTPSKGGGLRRLFGRAKADDYSP